RGAIARGFSGRSSGRSFGGAFFSGMAGRSPATGFGGCLVMRHPCRLAPPCGNFCRACALFSHHYAGAYMNPRLPVPLFLVILGFSFTVLNAQPSAPPAYHTERFDSLGPSANPGGRYSGLTGYAAPDGREYALLGGFRGTYIIDVTEAPVRLAALVEGPTSEWRELKTFRNYAYVVNESGGGLQIIDLSTLPEPPVLVMHDSSV